MSKQIPLYEEGDDDDPIAAALSMGAPLSTDQLLRAIYGQVKRTNGRVNAVERDIAGLKQYRAAAAGGLAVLTAVVVPIFLKLVFA